ncbi:MAG: hypothetical protein FJ304_09175 [Planctomycetes bacterium]|nr:hypothetical protein [Planctomycetota bacterium]
MTGTDTVERVRADGPRAFARWDAAVFDAVARGPATMLAQNLNGDDDAARAFDSYMRLVRQGVGAGLLTRAAPGAAGWSSFLERLLLEVAPAQLADLPAERRVPALVDLWNLGEGLLREPPWVDRYVCSCVRVAPKLNALAEFLTRVLAPVLTPAPPAAWTGPLRVAVLDLREVHDDFMPGKLRLAAPAVLCVEDRRRPGLHVGVHLRRGQRSEPLGVLAGLGAYEEAGRLPGVQFDDGRVRVGTKAVEVPTLRRCHGYTVARAGFVAACAVDSQRLWVIESE